MGLCFSSHSSVTVPPAPAARFAAQPGGGRPLGQWSVQDVSDFLVRLELPSLVQRFQQDGVDGPMLKSLSDEDLVEHLGCTELQVRKIRANLPPAGGAAPPPPAAKQAPAYAPPTISPLPAPAPFAAASMHHPPPPVAGVPLAAPVAAAPPPAAVPLVPTAPVMAPAVPVAVPLAAAAPVAAAAAVAAAPPAAAPAAPVAAAAPAALPAPAAAPAPGVEAAVGDAVVELERVALDLRTKAAEAQQHAGTYGRAAALLQQAAGKLQSAAQSLSVTAFSSTMGVGRTIGVAASGIRGPRRRAMMRGSPAQTMIDAATVRRADVAVQSAAADIAQARAVLPTIPFIQQALVSGARRGVFVRVLAPGVMTGMLQASQVRRGLDSIQQMLAQVRQALDWTQRNASAFESQAAQLNAAAATKQAEVEAKRRTQAGV